MAIKSWKVNINQGYFISWFVTTQAANLVTVTLKDEYTAYFSESKQSTAIAPPLATGCAFVDGRELIVTVDVPESLRLLGDPHSNDILTDKGIIVGKEFTLFLEDQQDMDCNDVSINIIGWASKG
jgi:hypothetical protein